MATQSHRTFRRLLHLIADGAWPAGHKLPPSRQMEREFGVSHGTMIKVLAEAVDSRLLECRSRRPAVVLPGAQDKARALLRQMSGRINSGRHRIAVLVPEAMWPLKAAAFWTDMLAEVDRAAQMRNWSIEMLRWPLIDQVRFSYDLLGGEFDAAFATNADHSYLVSLHILLQQRFPTLIWNRRFSQVPLPSVLQDDAGATRTLADLLIQAGHRNMLMLLYVADRFFLPGHERYKAWMSYLQEKELLEECVLPVAHIVTNSDLKAIAALLQTPQAPTAVVFGHGLMAEAFLGSGRFNHLRIPHDLSIVTFDWVRNLPGVNWCPPMTRVQPDLARGARCVIEMFERMFEGELIPPNVRIPMDLHLGESIARPAGTV